MTEETCIYPYANFRVPPARQGLFCLSRQRQNCCKVLSMPNRCLQKMLLKTSYAKTISSTRAAVPKVQVATQTWVMKGKKWTSPRWFKSVKMNFFLSFFKFFPFRHRLNYCIIRISFGFVLLKLNYCIKSGFPRVLMAAQLFAVTSQPVAKLRFIDYWSILELNSSVEYQGW